MKLKEYKDRALKENDFYREYNRYDLAFEIGQIVLEARLYAGITQKMLAEKLKTQQPSIARLENGKSLPSLGFLQKVANAMGTYLIAPRFAFIPEKKEMISAAKNSTQIFKTKEVPIDSNYFSINNTLSVSDTQLIPV